MQSRNRKSKVESVELLLSLLIPIGTQVVLGIGAIIPYIGFLFQWLGPFLALFLFFYIGVFIGEKVRKASPTGRALLLAYTLVVCTSTFAVSYFVGYYTFPVKVGRAVAAEKHENLTYEQASSYAKDILREETGSDGVIAYAIYSERSQLSSHSYGEYIGSQFEDLDSLEGLITALLNIVLHTIPMALKGILCDMLKLVSEAGYVGLVFWYLFSVALSYFGYSVSKA